MKMLTPGRAKNIDFTPPKNDSRSGCVELLESLSFKDQQLEIHRDGAWIVESSELCREISEAKEDNVGFGHQEELYFQEIERAARGESFPLESIEKIEILKSKNPHDSIGMRLEVSAVKVVAAGHEGNRIQKAQ